MFTKNILYRETHKDAIKNLLEIIYESIKLQEKKLYAEICVAQCFYILAVNYQKEKVIKIQFTIASENKVPTLKSH